MPDKPLLVIGNRNYSSWSLRAWLALRKSGVAFDELLLPLDTREFTAEIARYSPTDRVPVLWDDGHCVWDSLAICEYVNERFAAGSLWPADVAARGRGRSLAAEMHAGFAHLRRELPMNIRARRRVKGSRDLQRDLQRLFAAWRESLSSYGDQGPWLLGRFSIADAMYAPVVMRLSGYEVALPSDIAGYVERVREDHDMQVWIAAARAEEWIVAADEAGTEIEGD